MLRQYVEFILAEGRWLILLSGAIITMGIFLLSPLTGWQGGYKGRIGPDHQPIVHIRRYGRVFWNLKIPNKMKVFGWRACADILATRVNLGWKLSKTAEKKFKGS